MASSRKLHALVTGSSEDLIVVFTVRSRLNRIFWFRRRISLFRRFVTARSDATAVGCKLSEPTTRVILWPKLLRLHFPPGVHDPRSIDFPARSSSLFHRPYSTRNPPHSCSPTARALFYTLWRRLSLSHGVPCIGWGRIPAIANPDSNVESVFKRRLLRIALTSRRTATRHFRDRLFLRSSQQCSGVC